MAEGGRLLAELKVPAGDEFIGIAKRVAASLGGQLGFGLDEIDELCIAVAQACGDSIVAAGEMWGGGATLKLSYSSTARGIAVDIETLSPRSEGALPAPRRRAPARGPAVALEADRREAVAAQRELAQAMIRLFVDDFRPQVDYGRRFMHYRMVKYRVS